MTRVLLVALALGACAAPAPRAPAPRRPLNLIVISLGNVGARHMSLYGYGRPTTPGLERWSKGAVLFERAYTPASWTLPVAASVMTGLSPRAHGLMSRNVGNRLDASVPTLAALLRARGWSTGAFTGGLDYDEGFGHMRGFQVSADNLPFEMMDLTIRQAARWLERRAQEPYFVFIHGYDAHCPFPADEEFVGAVSGRSSLPPTPEGTAGRCARAVENSTGAIRLDYVLDWCRDDPGCPSKSVVLTPELESRQRDAYDDTVRQEDARVAAFLESLSPALLSRTVVAVYGDHGEMFAKNGRFGRLGPVRATLYEDVLHVPLLIKAPGLAPRRVRGTVELASLAPTLLDLLGVGASGFAAGAAPSLAPALAGETAQAGAVHSGLELFAAAGGSAAVRRGEADAVMDGRWKLIRESFFDPPRESLELYDLEADAAESRDLAGSRPEEVARLKALLERRRARDAGAARAPGTVEIREEIRRAVRIHGYW